MQLVAYNLHNQQTQRFSRWVTFILVNGSSRISRYDQKDTSLLRGRSERVRIVLDKEVETCLHVSSLSLRSL